jgi:hypothetical protein
MPEMVDAARELLAFLVACEASARIGGDGWAAGAQWRGRCAEALARVYTEIGAIKVCMYVGLCGTQVGWVHAA